MSPFEKKAPNADVQWIREIQNKHTGTYSWDQEA
jgi:hypothetical protein